VVPVPSQGEVRAWTPLLSDTDADRAREAVGEIADAVRDPKTFEIDPELTGPGLAGGSPGAAVLFAHLGQNETALEFLDRALERASDDTPSLPLYVGTPGVGWTLAYLERFVLDPDEGDNDVDELVDIGLKSQFARREFDLIRGTTGLGVYLIERGRPIDGVVTALADSATETGDGITWWVDPRTVLPERAELFPDGYYDVGMAHGQAGVVAMLAHGYAAGTESAKPLLENALRWLLAQRLPEGEGPGRYPLLFGMDGKRSGGRMAWCYGDIGVAVALLAAGRALGDDAVLEEAHDLALFCADRPMEHAGVLDASLCHGSAGLALMFARLAHAFDEEKLADSARTWGRVILDQRIPGEPVGGIQYSVPQGDERGFEPRGGLLEGATGAALVLHALSTDVAPDWDVLLLSRPVS